MGAVLTLAAEDAGCRLESASVELVEPSTFRVMALYRCGHLACWYRYLQIDGRVSGSSRACETGAGDRITVPPSRPDSYVDPMGEQK